MKWKRWWEKNLFFIWIISSVLFAVIVHCFFSIAAPNAWLAAKWSAGDILTFVSTVALGLLALWQNKKFKEENDISQRRLEKLTMQANELTIVSKIIEFEADNLSRLRCAYEEFSTACDPQNLASIFVRSTDSSNPMLTVFAETALAEKCVDDSFFALCRELKLDIDVYKNDKSSVKNLTWKYYSAAKEFIEKAREISVTPPTEEIKVLDDIRNDFVEVREKYLYYRTEKLNKIIFGNMTLDEIKKMYHSELVYNQKNMEK